MAMTGLLRAETPTVADNPAPAKPGRLLAPDHRVEVVPAVLEVLDRAVVARGIERLEAQVGEGDRLDVGRGVGGDAVAREREVARGQDAALRVLNVHVGDAGQ